MDRIGYDRRARGQEGKRAKGQEGKGGMGRMGGRRGERERERKRKARRINDSSLSSSDNKESARKGGTGEPSGADRK